MNKLLNLVKSYLSLKSNTFAGYKIIKKTPIDQTKHKCIWQVADYDLYSGKRKKIVGSKEILVGIDFTVNFLKKQNSTYKVLIVSSNSVDAAKIKKSLIDFFDAVFVVDNLGLDLGSHKAGFKIMNDLYSEVSSFPFVVSNSSFNPIDSKAINSLLTFSSEENVLIGVSYAYGPRYYLLKRMHLQSFFLISNYRNFKYIFNKLKLGTNNKLKIIRDGEIKISEIALKRKLALICYDGNVFRIFNEPLYSFFFYDHRSTQDCINSL